MNKAQVTNFGPSFMYYAEFHFGAEFQVAVEASHLKGYKIKLPNGKLLSVQFGTINDCANKFADSRSYPLYVTDSAEVADLSTDDWQASIKTYQSIEEVIDWIAEKASEQTGETTIMAKENYTLSPWGTIQDLGKFQGEMWYIPELWELTMITGEDETVWDNDRPHSVFFVDEEMRQKYGLSPDVYAIVLWENDYGFVNSSHVSEVDYNTWLSDIEENETESDI